MASLYAVKRYVMDILQKFIYKWTQNIFTFNIAQGLKS